MRKSRLFDAHEFLILLFTAQGQRLDVDSRLGWMDREMNLMNM